jgi:hypothetical protein
MALLWGICDDPTHDPGLPQTREVRTMELTHVFTAFVDVGAPLDLGPVSTGRRRIVPILGGTVEGPRLTASILPGGADWQVIREDGTAEVVARYTLRTSDGGLISVENKGLRRGPPEAIARLAAGENVDPRSYYFRTSPVFEFAPGPHRWLMDNIFVATGERRAAQVVIAVYVLS